MSSKSLDDIQSARSQLPPTGDEEVAYIVDGSGPSGTFVWGTDDLRTDVKQTLADYLSCLSSEKKNTYQIDSGLTEVSISDANGYPADIVTGGENSQKFTGNLSNWSPDFLDGKSSDRVGDYLSKGKPKESGHFDGHNLLSSVVGVTSIKDGMTGKATSVYEGATPAERQISQVLRSNRFNPTPGNSPYVETGQIPTTMGRLRSTLGTSDGGVEMPVVDLQKVGASLMLMAAGDTGESDPDDVSGLFLGQGVQLGTTRIPPTTLTPRRSFPLRDVERVTLESEIVSNGGDPEYYSYGHVNSPASPFGGFAPINMVALGAAMTTTMMVGSEVIFGILALIVNTDGKSVRMAPGPFILGEYGRPEADGLISTLVGPKALGLIHTENDYFDAARRGANVFFGFSGESLSQATETALLNLIQSPGYYVTVVRVILRSLNTISNSLKDVSFTNPIAGAQAVLGLIDVIKSSKIISFFNACAALGDIIINEELSGVPAVPGEKAVNSLIDSLDDRIVNEDKLPAGVVQRPGMAVMKSRSKSGPTSLALAWRASSAPAMYVLPKGVINASLDFGANSGLARGVLGGNHSDKFRVTTSAPRLTQDDVRVMEDALEAEYVPFYFHDLRTNEIVSFHAFLKALTETYSPSYEENDGYGRIDPVMIYKSTRRNLEMSFVVAATSEEDFDDMWWRVNKIVTLLYPQWGQGRDLQAPASGAKFIQPFSQVPTASPLCRLRVGDLIKSNYSKFNLSRIFGMGTETFTPNSSYVPAEFDESKLGKVKDVIKMMTSDPDITGASNEDLGFAKGDQAFLRATQAGYYLESTPAGNILTQAVAVISKGSVRRKVKIPVDVPVKVMSREVKQLDRTKVNFRTEAKTIYTVSFLEDVPGITTEGITEVEVSHADLKIDPGYVLVKSDVFTSEDIEAVTSNDIADFFSRENNFVVRSFESVMGRGLAGVITNFNVDWQAPVWETSRGRRAPKYCEINLSFTAIHDLPPGLDDQGFNRAPNYNVGGLVSSVAGDVYDQAIGDLDANVRQLWLKVAGSLSQVKT